MGVKPPQALGVSLSGTEDHVFFTWSINFEQLCTPKSHRSLTALLEGILQVAGLSVKPLVLLGLLQQCLNEAPLRSRELHNLLYQYSLTKNTNCHCVGLLSVYGVGFIRVIFHSCGLEIKIFIIFTTLHFSIFFLPLFGDTAVHSEVMVGVDLDMI